LILEENKRSTTAKS